MDIDEMDENDYKSIIIRKIEGNNVFEDESRKGPTTKDGKSYGSFNSLM
jgi:hypothetical protein